MTRELTDVNQTGYSHTQSAPICWLLYTLALGLVACCVLTSEPVGRVITGAVGAVFALLAPCFHHLRVEDRGDILAIKFGPIPVFHRTVRYDQIQSVEVGRTMLSDGLGIHMSLRGGWVWNIWGRACVVIHFENGVLRIGSDDTENLVRFLESKIYSGTR